MKKRIFVLVDFQNDFVQPNGVLTINNPKLIERVQKFANNLQQGMFDEIIITADTHFKETYHQTPESDSFPIHCVYGTKGWEQAVQFKDNIPVSTLYKSTTNLWNEFASYKLLQQNWKGTEVYMAGVLSDICVQQGMEGFLKCGAKVTLFEDLTQGLNRQTPEVVSEPKYKNAVELGGLKSMTTAQFFRRIINEKKCALNLVNNDKGM